MNVFIKVFFGAFTTILLAIMFNTIMFGYLFPIFDGINAATGMGGASYTQISTMIKYSFAFALNIIVIVPYLYLFNWLTKKEPKTETMDGGYYYVG